MSEAFGSAGGATGASAAASPLASDLPGALLLSAVFLGLLAAAELWRRFGNPQAEWTRKLVHLGGGLACLAFPFLVRSPWAVLAMALPLSALFAAGARFGFLKSLHGVGRPSRGAEYYPLAVWLVFVIAQGRPWLYLAAVLVLAVGDAFAALVGSRYGRLRYAVEDSSKSLEGSLVFLVLAFLAIHLPTLLLTDLPRPVCVLAALLVAALVTGFEAISLEGADNLFVPLAVAVVLAKITTKPLGEVVFQNLSLAVIALAVALVVWRLPTLNVGGAIAFILYAYGAWSLGNWQWALPALVGFALYAACWAGAPHGYAGVRVRTVARALLAPFSLLALANASGWFAPLYGPYLAASGTVLALSLASGVFRLHRLGEGRRAAAALGIGLAAAAVVTLPPWLAQAAVPAAAPAAVAAAVVLATAGALAAEVRHLEAAVGREWTAVRFLASYAAAALVAAATAAGLVAAWQPLVVADWRWF